MSSVKNFLRNDNNIITAGKGPFEVIEHFEEVLITELNAQAMYYASKMKVRRKQLVCSVAKADITANAMNVQWTIGDIKSNKNKETFVNRIDYTGTGMMVLKPTYEHILLINVNEWESVVTKDKLFLACESKLTQKSNMNVGSVSSIIKESSSLNLIFSGDGILALKSNIPIKNLIEIELDDDILKVNGDLAKAWSSSLTLTTERIRMKEDDFMYIYKGTGKILMAPVM